MPKNQLVKDTAVYGISSILGKFLNWLLVPLYVEVLASPAEYSVVTNLYAFTALLLVILTYGMETGFFRFMNRENAPARTIYGTSLLSVGSTSLLFALVVVLFAQPIATMLHYETHSEYIWMLGISVSLDAFACIPFAYLRYRKMPLRFAALKMLYVALNIALNLFFLLLCPYLMRYAPQTVSWFYDADYGVGYVFVSNIIATSIQTLFLLPYVVKMRNATLSHTADFPLFDFRLLRQMLAYSLPLLALGITGIMNQNFDKLIFPFLLKGEFGKEQLGIYGAVSKMALVMMMFTQAFRYAYEPFVFAQKTDSNNLQARSREMTFFIVFSLLIFLGMVFYVDILKLLFRDKTYLTGFSVLPMILVTYIFQGIYFNLSFWYKLTDKTVFGLLFSGLGTVIIVLGNVLLVPVLSYWGCVIAAFVCYGLMMTGCYLLGRKYLKIPYDLRIVGLFCALAALLYGISVVAVTPYISLNYLIRTLLLGLFVLTAVKKLKIRMNN